MFPLDCTCVATKVKYSLAYTLEFRYVTMRHHIEETHAPLCLTDCRGVIFLVFLTLKNIEFWLYRDIKSCL